MCTTPGVEVSMIVAVASAERRSNCQPGDRFACSAPFSRPMSFSFGLFDANILSPKR